MTYHFDVGYMVRINYVSSSTKAFGYRSAGDDSLNHTNQLCTSQVAFLEGESLAYRANATHVVIPLVVFHMAPSNVYSYEPT